MWTQYLRLKNIENITIEVTKWSIIVKPHETTYTLEVTTSVGKFYYQKKNIFQSFDFRAIFQQIC